MTASVKQLAKVADAVVPRITPGEARDLLAKGNTLVADVHDAPEVEMTGKVAGALRVSRGMLEAPYPPLSGRIKRRGKAKVSRPATVRAEPCS